MVATRPGFAFISMKPEQICLKHRSIHVKYFCKIRRLLNKAPSPWSLRVIFQKALSEKSSAKCLIVSA